VAGRRADRLLQIGVALDENLDSTVLHINTLALVESPLRGLRSAHATTWNVFLWGVKNNLNVAWSFLGHRLGSWSRTRIRLRSRVRLHRHRADAAKRWGIAISRVRMLPTSVVETELLALGRVFSSSASSSDFSVHPA